MKKRERGIETGAIGMKDECWIFVERGWKKAGRWEAASRECAALGVSKMAVGSHL